MGKWKQKQQSFINPFEIVATPNNEYSVFKYHSSLQIWRKTSKVNNVFGPVFIKKIEKGTNYDIVYCDIGYGRQEKTWKKFICQTHLTRKQIYTLTVNQYALVYALSMRENKVFYVKAWWASYIPKIHDRQDIESSPDFVPFGKVDETQPLEQEALDLLDEIERFKK